jgi:hypothetical protein
VPRKQFAHQAGKFVKHVVPAAFKPVHSLWHEIMGFIFLGLAALVSWKIYRTPSLSPWLLAVFIPFVAVMLIQGVLSFRKARRISRS